MAQTAPGCATRSASTVVTSPTISSAKTGTPISTSLLPIESSDTNDASEMPSTVAMVTTLAPTTCAGARSKPAASGGMCVGDACVGDAGVGDAGVGDAGVGEAVMGGVGTGKVGIGETGDVVLGDAGAGNVGTVGVGVSDVRKEADAMMPINRAAGGLRRTTPSSRSGRGTAGHERPGSGIVGATVPLELYDCRAQFVALRSSHSPRWSRTA